MVAKNPEVYTLEEMKDALGYKIGDQVAFVDPDDVEVEHIGHIRGIHGSLKASNLPVFVGRCRRPSSPYSF